MKALILNNKVVDLHEQEFKIHPSLIWIDCDNTVKIGDNYNGSSFSRNIITFEMAIETLRAKRNKLLSDTDYLALADNTMTEEARIYRQALRDITEGLTTKEQVEAVVFPTKP